jgi:hypothetical protein
MIRAPKLVNVPCRLQKFLNQLQAAAAGEADSEEV